MAIPQLDAQIRDILKQLPAANAFEIYTISTTATPIASLTPKQRLPTVHATRTTELKRLILLVQKNQRNMHPSGGEGGQEERHLVCGLSVREFVTVVAYPAQARQRTQSGAPVPHAEIHANVYLEKIDSSGHLSLSQTSAISPMRAAITGYLAFVTQLYHDVLKSLRVYTFARAQPEYLFAMSSKNRNKHQLDDAQLVRWWKKSFDIAGTYIASRYPQKLPSHIKASAFLPGSDHSEAGWLKETCPFPQALRPSFGSALQVGDRCQWSWGLGYPPDAKAHDCIPQYPDDPMTRLLQKPESAKWTVENAMDMVAISEECGAGRRTAFFALDIPTCSPHFFGCSSTSTPSTSGPSSPRHALNIPLLSHREFEQVELSLFDHSMDFSQSQTSLQSTARFTKWLGSRFPSIKPLEMITSGSAVVIDNAAQETSGGTQNDSHSSKRNTEAVVNTLSTNIVRKKQKVKP
ncbi:hypothetical protein H4219_002755 [Mycoemilia scoparia]|uniref:histone acetyltransferase n=1 Tax=Mycoemilia scoparia TaxID=417184 RepID=A0A9W7ZXH3_9FUNG|nr:hypothetical protein H4219_002755 [Mycoemilia scoparia]